MLERRGTWIAGVAAALTAAPGLVLPYLADDWANLSRAAGPLPLHTPFGYFRPLYVASFRAEFLVWGVAPALSHAVNAVLLVVASALVVRVVSRYTSDDRLAGWAGVLFAVHPVHVVGAAWVAARADLLAAVGALATLLLYERWREHGGRGVPLAAMLCLGLAGLAKEAVVVVPPLLLLLALVVRGRRPAWRGLLSMFVVAAALSVVQRFVAAGEAWQRIAPEGVAGPLRTLALYAAAAIVPLQGETLETWPATFAGVALASTLVLFVVARSGAGRVQPAVWVSLAAFPVLLGPALLFSFQERFLLLPSVAASAAIAGTLAGGRVVPRRVATTLLLTGWLLALVSQWQAWFEAGRVGERLVEDLVRHARRPGVEEIVVANPPHRVHGAPVVADFAAAVRLSGGGEVEVRWPLAVDLPSARAGSLEDASATPEGDALEVRLRVPRVPFSRAVSGPGRVASEVTRLSAERWRVRIDRGAGRVILVWTPDGLRTTLDP